MCGYGEHVCVLCRHVGGSFVCTRMCVCVVWVCVLEDGYNEVYTFIIIVLCCKERVRGFFIRLLGASPTLA